MEKVGQFYRTLRKFGPWTESDARPAKDRFVALIGDVSGSRDEPDRARLQDRLLGAVEEANRGWHDALAAQVDVTGGDEVKALTKDPRSAYEIARHLNDRIWPKTMRFGIGWGAITTNLHENVGRVDGPCFHEARRAMDWGRGRGIPIAFAGFGSAGHLAAHMLDLVWRARAEWTDRQRTYATAFEHGHSLTEIAKMHDRTKGTVSQALQSTQPLRLMESEDAAITLLAAPWEADG